MNPEVRTTKIIDGHVRWPYPAKDYLRRAIWRIIQGTLVRFVPARIPFWYSFWLRLFSAEVGYVGFAPTVSIFHPWLLKIGNNCSIGDRVTIYNLGPVSIGDYTVISQDVYVCAGTHDHTIVGLPLIRSPITIGSNVWICAGAFIGPGVHVGDGAVVGARAVVVKDVEPWTVVAGNPAKQINRRIIRDR